MGIGCEIYFEKVVAELGGGHMVKIWGSSSTGVQGPCWTMTWLRFSLQGKHMIKSKVGRKGFMSASNS